MSETILGMRLGMRKERLGGEKSGKGFVWCRRFKNSAVLPAIREGLDVTHRGWVRGDMALHRSLRRESES